MNQELRIIVRADGTAQVVGDLNKVNAATQKTGSAFASMAKSIIATAAAYMSIRQAIQLFNKSIDAAREQSIAIKQLNNSLANAGHLTNQVSDNMRNLASQLQAVSNYGDEEILVGVTSSLLRYRNIAIDTFPRVQKAVLDVAAAMGGEGGLENAARQVAVALEDPILGMTRLRRSGIIFSQEQQDVIKSLVETGKLSEAQGLILDELEKKFAGTAQAGINSAIQLKNAWGDYLEQVGMAAEKSMSYVNQGVKAALVAMEQSLSDFNKGTDNADLNSKVKWANITSYIVLATKAIVKTIMNAMELIGSFLIDFWDAVYKSLINVFNGIKSLFIGLISGIGSLMPAAIAALQGNFAEAGNIIGQAFAEPFKNHTFFAIDDLFKNTDRALSKLTNTWHTYSKEVASAQLRNTQDALNAINALGKGSASILNLGETNETGSGLAALEGQLIDIQSIIKSMNDMPVNQKPLVQFPNKADFDSAKAVYNDMLSAQLVYLQATKALSNERLNGEIQVYANEIQAYLGKGLNQIQIDEMVAARRKEIEQQITEDRISEWKKQNELQAQLIDTAINYWANAMGQFLQIETDTNSKVLQAFTGFINAMIAELTRYISKLLVAAAIKTLIGGTDSRGFFGNFMGLLGAGTGSGSGSSPDLGGSTRSVNYTPPRTQPQAPQVMVYTQVIEGVPFANAVNRAQRVANEL